MSSRTGLDVNARTELRSRRNWQRLNKFIEQGSLGGVPLANFIGGETPSGTVNGSNPTFILANAPAAGTVHVYVDGLRMHAGAGNDYTISGGTLTFLTGAIPETGDVILVDYIKA